MGGVVMVSGTECADRLARRLAWVALACSVLAPLADAQTTQEGGGATLTTRPAYSRVEKVPEELFDDSRRSVILLPSTPGDVGQPSVDRSQGIHQRIAPETPLLPEGYVVASREARIEPQGDWLVAHLRKATDLPDSPPLRLLPNQQLSMLQAVLGQQPPPTGFLITGRITEFLGANYILIESIEEVLTDSTETTVTAAQAEPQSAPSNTSGGREPTAEEILKQLLSRPTRRSVALPQLSQVIPDGEGTMSATETRPESLAFASSLMPERAMLVDRVGRVVPGEKWWTLVFENRGRQAADKPIRLLPSRLLESAISLSKGGTQTPVFILSGEVTTYENHNYVLLRKVLLRRQAGNIR